MPKSKSKRLKQLAIASQKKNKNQMRDMRLFIDIKLAKDYGHIKQFT